MPDNPITEASPAPQSFENGARVRLKSGGPIMTVAYSEGGYASSAHGKATCLWFDSDHRLQSAAIPANCLSDAAPAALATLQSPPAGVGEDKMAASQIVMGHGLVDVGQIKWNGRSGILLRPRANHIPMGDPGEIAGDYWPTAQDVVIWIDKPEGAQVIIDELRALATPQSPAGGEGPLSGEHHPAFQGHGRMDWPTLDGPWRQGGWGDEPVANRTTVMRFIGSIDALLAENAALRAATPAGESALREAAKIERADLVLSPVDVGRHHPVTEEAIQREVDGLQALALRAQERGDDEGYTAAHGGAELIGLLWQKVHG